jgi:transposase
VTEASAGQATHGPARHSSSSPWLWLRYQPGRALAAWFRQRVGTLQGRTRRIAIVAMARKLLMALWRYVETGVTLDGVEFRAEADVTA